LRFKQLFQTELCYEHCSISEQQRKGILSGTHNEQQGKHEQVSLSFFAALEISFVTALLSMETTKKQKELLKSKAPGLV